jgi:hypothetical protein
MTTSKQYLLNLVCMYTDSLTSRSFLLEAGIFASHLIWLCRTRKLRKRATLAGINFDDLPEARPYQVRPKGEKEDPTGVETGPSAEPEIEMSSSDPRTAPPLGHSIIRAAPHAT